MVILQTWDLLLVFCSYCKNKTTFRGYFLKSQVKNNVLRLGNKNNNENSKHQQKDSDFSRQDTADMRNTKIYIICLQYYQMRQNRKNWSTEQDQAITSLVKKYGTKRWTLISEKMKERFYEEGRSGKQCRERWHNHLSPAINKQPWTEQQLKLVFDSHRRFGNRWTEIAQLLKGRTDNAVKNQFYSTLRKGLRRMCKVLGTRNSTTRIKKIKPTALSSMISNITEIPIGEDDNEQELYDMLFEFSNGDKFEQLKEKTLTDKYRDNMERLLQKILDSKEINRRRRAKPVAEKPIQHQKPDSEIGTKQVHKLEQLKPCSMKLIPSMADEDLHKFDFNISLENSLQDQDNYNEIMGHENRPLSDFQFETFNEDLEFRYDRPISLKKQNSQPENKQDQILVPLKQQCSQTDKPIKRGNQFGAQNNQNHYKSFLSRSPSCSSKVRMPTPRICDTSSHILALGTQLDEHRNEEPMRELEGIVQELRSKVNSRMDKERLR